MPLMLETELTHKRLRDLETFARWQLASQDVDPAYPILRSLSFHDREAALWHTFVYVAFYNIASATLFWPKWERYLNGGPEPDWASYNYPTGTERRGLRGGHAMAAHLGAVRRIARQHGSLYSWLTHNFDDDQRKNWQRLQETLVMPYQNGRWAAYKTGEILKTVHDFPVHPTDMGMSFSSGPRWGLDLFYGKLAGNDSATVRILDDRAKNLQEIMAMGGLFVPIEQLETCLCDFHSLCEGRYYVGHDIDQIQEQILVAQTRFEEPLASLWFARSQALPAWTLGESNGWQGIRKPLKLVYPQRGVVEWWNVQTVWAGPGENDGI